MLPTAGPQIGSAQIKSDLNRGIVSLLSEFLPAHVDTLQLDDVLADFGLDSLAFARLTNAIEV